MKFKQLWLPVFLSIIPGFGHLYLKHFKKSVSLLIVFSIMATLFLITQSAFVKLLMFFVITSLVITSIVEVYFLAKQEGDVDIFSRPYIVFMLFTAGMSAFPLLWQSSLFSKYEKIIWTVFVIVLAGLFFFFLAKYWAELETLANHYFGHFFNH